MSITEIIAKKLNISKEELERNAIKEWLERKLLLIKSEINEIKTKYNIKSINEFKEKIRTGEIKEHPGWEDLITLESLLKEKLKIEEALKLI